MVDTSEYQLYEKSLHTTNKQSLSILQYKCQVARSHITAHIITDASKKILTQNTVVASNFLHPFYRKGTYSSHLGN